MVKLLWLAFFAVVASVSGTETCQPAPPELTAPDLVRIGGLWFKQASTSPYEHEETNYKCNQAVNLYNDQNDTLRVLTYSYNTYGGPQTQDWVGDVYKTNGKFVNTFEKPEGEHLPYFVFYADNYATIQIVYGCPVKNGVAASSPIMWIQTRECEYNQDLIDQAMDKLKNVPGIENVKWNKFGGPTCCNQKSSSWSS